MNILLISTHLNIGGITTYLYGICREYRALGHNVVLITSGGVRAGEFLDLGVVLETAAVKTKFELNPRMFADTPRLLRVIKERDIQIIHGHTRVTQVFGQVLGALSGVPYVSTCHGFYKTHWFRRKFPCWGEGVAAISPAVRDHLLHDFKMPERRVFLIPNGVNVDSFPLTDEVLRKAAREKFGIKDHPVIGIVSRLADIKGHVYLIKAMPKILAEFPRALLFVAGEGKMKAELKALVASLGIEERVLFASSFASSAEVLKLFDVFVMPSTDEGFGLAGMEAQCAGLPIVASNIGGIPSFVFHERTGLLVPPKDPDALSEAIVRFLRDPDFSARVGRQSRDSVFENFSIKTTARKTIAMYEAVIHERLSKRH